MARIQVKAMELPPPPQFPINEPAPDTLERGNRSSTKPAWVKQNGPIPIEVPAGLIPPEIDPDNLRMADEIVAGGELPRVRPIFLGLRSRLNARRLEHSHNLIDRQARSNAVLRFAGESIYRGVQGQNFSHPTQDLRPDTSRDRRAVRHLDRIMNARDLRQSFASKTAMPYMYDQVGEREGGHSPRLREPNFERPGVRRAPNEIRHDNGNAVHYRRLRGQINRRDSYFHLVVNAPYNAAQRQIARRERLILRSAAIEAAMEDYEPVLRRVGGRLRSAGNSGRERLAAGARRVRFAGNLAVHGAATGGRFAVEVGRRTARGAAVAGRATGILAGRAARAGGRKVAEHAKPLAANLAVSGRALRQEVIEQAKKPQPEPKPEAEPEPSVDDEEPLDETDL